MDSSLTTLLFDAMKATHEMTLPSYSPQSTAYPNGVTNNPNGVAGCNSPYLSSWVTDRDPPAPGVYLLTLSIDIHSDGNRTYFVNTTRWDGKSWGCGGYVQPEAWRENVEPWRPSDIQPQPIDR